MNIETREQFYTNIINLAAMPPLGSYDKSWVRHEKLLDRALALANLGLKHYQEQGDQSGITDAEWVISKIMKHREQVNE